MYALNVLGLSFDLLGYPAMANLVSMNITLSSKPGMIFLKEYQTGMCQFEALTRAKLGYF